MFLGSLIINQVLIISVVNTLNFVSLIYYLFLIIDALVLVLVTDIGNFYHYLSG